MLSVLIMLTYKNNKNTQSGKKLLEVMAIFMAQMLVMFQECIFVSKFIKSYILNMYTILYVNHTLIKQFFKNNLWEDILRL